MFLEFDGQNQTEAIVECSKMDFFLCRYMFVLGAANYTVKFNLILKANKHIYISR
jgi:hypothetical protein